MPKPAAFFARSRCVWLVALTLLGGLASADPKTALDGLLAADRKFAAAAVGKDMVGALAPMLAEDVIMPAPPGQLVQGKDAVLAAIKANPANADTRLASWSPQRGGISADGSQGYTFGYLHVRPAAGEVIDQKYLAYWVLTEAGWRVRAYKRTRGGKGTAGPVKLAMDLPQAPAAAVADQTALAKSLMDAEQAFSDLAQQIGLGAAFTAQGREDAINLGGPNDAGFVIGPEAIGKAVSAGSPVDASPVYWSAESVLVAPSGDLGVTFGLIRPNATPAEGEAPVIYPFFTIWRRDSVDQPWRYVAE